MEGKGEEPQHGLRFAWDGWDWDGVFTFFWMNGFDYSSPALNHFLFFTTAFFMAVASGGFEAAVCGLLRFLVL